MEKLHPEISSKCCFIIIEQVLKWSIPVHGGWNGNEKTQLYSGSWEKQQYYHRNRVNKTWSYPPIFESQLASSIRNFVRYINGTFWSSLRTNDMEGCHNGILRLLQHPSKEKIPYFATPTFTKSRFQPFLQTWKPTWKTESFMCQHLQHVVEVSVAIWLGHVGRSFSILYIRARANIYDWDILFPQGMLKRRLYLITYSTGVAENIFVPLNHKTCL